MCCQFDCSIERQVILAKLRKLPHIERPKYSIRLTAANNIGAPFPDNYRVRWRIMNTDKVATAAGQLRGDFYRSGASTPASRVEHLD